MTLLRPGAVSLSTFLAAIFGLIVFLAVGAASLIGWFSVREVTFELMEQKAQQSVAVLQAGIESHLRPVRAQVTGLGGLLSSGEIDWKDRQAFGNILRAGAAALPDLTVLGFVDPNLEHFSIVRMNDGRLELNSGSLRNDRDAQTRLTAIQEAGPAESARWGNIFYAEALHDAVVNITMPVWRAGQLEGFIVAGIATRRLTRLVDELGRQFGVTAFVLYGRSRVLVHPGLLSEPKVGSARVPLAGLDEVGDPVLAQLWQGRPQVLGTSGADSVNLRQIRNEDGQRFLVLYREVEGYGDRSWTLGAEVPEWEFTTMLGALRHQGMAGLAMTALALLIAILVAKLIARPIQRMTDGVRHVATLDIAQVPPLPPSRVRELNQQASAFNAMLGTLRAFEAYVPKSLVRRLIRETAEGGDGNEALTSRMRDLTVMFTDIVGFTSLAENLPPVEVAGLLNRHFAILAASVEAQGGTVDKYLGDGMMAFWGAPERVKDRAARACRAALAIRQAIVAENQRRAMAGRESVRLRIGIHRGPLLVGNIGAPDRVNYTVVGDAANVAQRLEELGRTWTDEEEVVILISDAVVAEIGAGFVTAPAGVVTLEGRKETLGTWRLVGMTPTSPPAAPPELVAALER